MLILTFNAIQSKDDDLTLLCSCQNCCLCMPTIGLHINKKKGLCIHALLNDELLVLNAQLAGLAKLFIQLPLSLPSLFIWLPLPLLSLFVPLPPIILLLSVQLPVILLWLSVQLSLVQL